MDLGSPSLCVCVMMVCLLGAAHCSTGGENKCKCQEIPQFPLTKDPLSSCSEITTSFRYSCIEGYVRKAGTSNRITCNQVNGSWTTPSLKCIPDPKRPQPPNTTVTPTSTSPLVIRIASTSVTAETEKAESTSPDLQVSSHKSTQVNLVTKTEETEKSASTSTTTEPSTFNPRVSDHTKLSNTSTALITLASIVIVCALIGLAFKKFYRRSKENTCHQPSKEEQIPMNQSP